MDVSFISATKVIPSLPPLLSDGAEFICLVKPQFEAGRGNVGKGVVKDDTIREKAVITVTEAANIHGFKKIAVIKSPILGGDGNIEYLVYFKYEDCNNY
jgi:23S rRNA (cytidine1920-2'-O)/16S rRNA (cytidine1409-2'-O)-methyltransferase